jgi:transposase
MKGKYHVNLNEEERCAIQGKMNSEETAATVRKRCNILLHADESAGKPPTQEEISVRCGVSDVTVYTTIKEYDTQGMEYCLRKRIHKTPPNPPIVTGEKEARIVALACGKAPEGRSRWTVRLLAEKVIELGIMETVSHETIRNTLKKHSSSLT